MNWGQKGRDLAKQLQGLRDEQSIKDLAFQSIQAIYAQETVPDKRANALKMINRELLKHFPRVNSETPAYWYDPKGREAQAKWRHLIFKHLTLSTPDWDAVGDEARQEWKATQNEQPTEQNQLTIQDMTIQQLDLDPETQTIVVSALEQSGMALPAFIKQAVRVYAKTITGKTQKKGEDLSTVPTDKLLNDAAYSTHPGRAEELTKRAIKAIKYYNSNVATEKADRWCITQSAIATLTGSRPSTVGKVLEQFKDDIESHNQTHDLDNYANRKRGKPSIEETIKLAELVPDGLD